MDVPRFKQKQNTCGPTALQMVLSHFGDSVTDAEILRAIGGLKPHGTNTVDLAHYARSRGFRVECLSYNKKLADGRAELRTPSKKDIIKYLHNGVPVILAVNATVLYGDSARTPGHFIVLTKHEDGLFTYNDPYDGDEHEIDEEHLMFAWHNNVLDSSAYFLALWPKDKNIVSV